MSVFQYTAEAYRLLLMLLGLIVGSLFGPLQLATWTMLLIWMAGGFWFFMVWMRKRARSGVAR